MKFDRIDTALSVALSRAIEEADYLNFNESKNDNKKYRIDLDSDYDVVIRGWDGNDYDIITAYNIEEI